MDPSRRHPDPPDSRRPSTREHEYEPSSSAPGPSASHTSLPPIRELHPGLAPSHMRPAMPPMAPYGSVASTSQSAASGSGSSLRPTLDESDPEDQEPPKKKRRRQALSCTECKRRKIKCDRAQPCGPCARRGEQLKCQWHIIEPMEKYVTRSEYDELKARVHELESLVSRMRAAPPPPLPGRMAMGSPGVALPPGHTPDPLPGTMITPYHTAPPGAGPPPYHRMPPPTRSPPDRGDPSARPEPLRPSSSHTPRSHTPRSPPHRSPTAYAPARPLPSPTDARPPPSPHAHAGPEAAGPSRRGSLSLAAITAPFIPDTKPPPPKKHPAQTLWPSERLRPIPSGSALAT